jgi:hypothetical protein
MALDPLFSEFADICPACEGVAVLRWSDSDLDNSICEDCAEDFLSTEKNESNAPPNDH